jgi:hypothetical protein
MNFLTEKAFELSRTGIFSYSDVLVWLGERRNSLRGLVKRAIAAGEIIHIRRGLYCLSPKFNRFGISRNVIANLVYGPSYVSMETALSIHGWIPEAVRSVISVSLGRAKTFETPIGYFDYVQIAQTPLFAGVERMEGESSAQAFLVAKPLKAVADYVASHGMDWLDSEPLEESLRIDCESIGGLTSADFDELEGVYKSRRARRFLAGLRRELGK